MRQSVPQAFLKSFILFYFVFWQISQMFCSKTWGIQLTSPNVRPPVAKKFMNTLYIIVYCICDLSESWYLLENNKNKNKKNSLKHVNERKAWSWELSPLWMKGHNWRSGPAGTERRSLWLEILLYCIPRPWKSEISLQKLSQLVRSNLAPEGST